MVRATTLQTLPLEGLTQGNTYAIVISNAQSAVTLEFRHAGDPTYRAHPELSALAAVGGVVSKALFCHTPDMRMVFASAPAEEYYVSCIPSAQSPF